MHKILNIHTINGTKTLEVSDEIYSAFMDPIWSEKKKEQRKFAYLKEISCYEISFDDPDFFESDPKNNRYRGLSEKYYASDPESVYLRSEFWNIMYSALKTLPEDEAKIVYFVDFEQNTVAEYARHFSIPYTTAQYRLNSGRKKMRTFLTNLK